MKLKEVAKIRSGNNFSRKSSAKTQNLPIYNVDDLNNDLSGDVDIEVTHGKQEVTVPLELREYMLNTGDVVYSYISRDAVVVSEHNYGKLFNQNFAKIELKGDIIDPYYLCYVLNESDDVKRQKSYFESGSTIRRLTSVQLSELDLNLPTIEQQQLIGKSYFKILKRQRLAEKKLKLEQQFLLEFLKENN